MGSQFDLLESTFFFVLFFDLTLGSSVFIPLKKRSSAFSKLWLCCTNRKKKAAVVSWGLSKGRRMQHVRILLWLSIFDKPNSYIEQIESSSGSDTAITWLFMYNKPSFSNWVPRFTIALLSILLNHQMVIVIFLSLLQDLDCNLL